MTMRERTSEHIWWTLFFWPCFLCYIAADVAVGCVRVLTVIHRVTHTCTVIKIHLIAATDTHWTSSVSIRVSAFGCDNGNLLESQALKRKQLYEYRHMNINTPHSHAPNRTSNNKLTHIVVADTTKNILAAANRTEIIAYIRTAQSAMNRRTHKTDDFKIYQQYSCEHDHVTTLTTQPSLYQTP